MAEGRSSSDGGPARPVDGASGGSGPATSGSGGCRRRRTVALALVLAVAGVAAGILAGGLLRQGQPARSGSEVRLATAPVRRASLTTTTQVSGSLGFAGSYRIVNQVAGVAYTRLPRAGAVARRGARLFEVDGSPVFLFYGSRPAWRTLALGVPAGPDVAQLDANLVALGYATAASLPVSSTFSPATAAAVERWQYARGLAVTGSVALGQIVYGPGPIRVASLRVALGQAAQPGTTALTATSAVPVVLADLPVSQEYLVRPRDRVSVLLPDGSTVAGRVTSVSRTAAAAQAGRGNSPADGQAASGSRDGGPTVTLVIRLARPRVAGHLDRAPVTVSIVSGRADGVLAVPITALVALAGGGYAVEVVHGSSARLAQVRTGLFTSTLVQVSGSGVRPGALVQVPAS